MFGIGSTEFLVILVVALVLIGPQKLPELLKAVGKGINEFRRMSSDVRSTLEREIERADEAKRIEETKKELFGDAPAQPEEAQAATAVPEAAAQPQADAAPQAAPAPAAVAETPGNGHDASGQPAAQAAADQQAQPAEAGHAAPVQAAKPEAPAQEKSHA
ncbi:Sec-independent protein translocase protein TatB [Fundidesulfovibrio terrae]|uniref:Sec-independent protein translocase protein TatB n=1 Tax=Fundidesulfovibrio terrae TaxID=2922866 RepID=UPI001FAF2CCF|nr:Sec-independent protein translocase protein TatB [Fundidesulfovibrio terrae]